MDQAQETENLLRRVKLLLDGRPAVQMNQLQETGSLCGRVKPLAGYSAAEQNQSQTLVRGYLHVRELDEMSVVLLSHLKELGRKVRPRK
jgi:hypothetical protein